MKHLLVQIDGKTYNKERFEPRRGQCVKVCRNGFVQPICVLSSVPKGLNAKEMHDCTFNCQLFGWDIRVALGQTQAVCSRKTKPLPFAVTMSQQEVLAEQARYNPFCSNFLGNKP